MRSLQDELASYRKRLSEAPAKIWEEFRGREAYALDSLRERVLAYLDARDHAETPARDLAVIYGILFDKTRLLRGQSTQNNLTLVILQAHGRGGDQTALDTTTCSVSQDDTPGHNLTVDVTPKQIK